MSNRQTADMAQDDDQLDLLAALAELEARSPLGPDRARTRTSSSRQSPSPRSSFERPLRTPSPTSRLQASFRTLAYQRSSSSLSREWQRDEEDGDAGGPPADEDDPKTPSVRQAGFASSPADVYPVTTQPPVSPRSAAAKARSTRSTTSTAGSDPSPRLVARPARNDYRPGDELAFFREMEQESRLGQDLPLDSASSQSLPRSSSLRAERLRLEIEREARRIRSQASLEELRQDAERASVLEQRVGAELDGLADGRAFSPSPSTSESAPGPETRSAPRVQASHLELRPSSAQASPFRGDETASVRSLGSVGSASFVSAAGSQRSLSARPAGSASTFSLQSGRAGSAQTDFAGAAAFGTGGNARRPRPREAREWTQACWLWTAERSASSKSPIAARLGKTVIKDVPSALKRRSNKRDSAPHLSPAEAMLFGVPGGGSTSSPSASPQTKEREKTKKREKSLSAGPAAATMDSGPASPSAAGRWRHVSAVLRDDGLLRVYGDSDTNILHSVPLSSRERHDVQLVDHSLFGRPHCLRIRCEPHAPSLTPSRPSFATASAPLREHIYICLPSLVASHVWLTMLRCFARPEHVPPTMSSIPRPVRAASRRDELSDESDGGADDDGRAEASLAGFHRVVRSLRVTINEGRGLGEPAPDMTRSATKVSSDRHAGGNGGGADTESTTSSQDYTTHVSPARSASSFALGRLPGRPGVEERADDATAQFYCELVVEGTVVAQSSVRKGLSPLWNETFSFQDLPPLLEPATIRLLQVSKSASNGARVVGTAEVRLPDITRQRLIEQWLPVQPITGTAALGELSVGVRISEDVVLAQERYADMLRLLREDDNTELATELAVSLSHELEDTTRTLLRIYSTQGLLLERIQRLAEREVEGNLRQNRSAVLLFRGNSILTKSLELYLRLVGTEYLDASIGDVVRRICSEKVEIEIDPAKIKPGAKEKELGQNVRSLRQWSKRLCDAIFSTRDKCPHDLRLIFHRLRSAVTRHYENGEDQPHIQRTCISAFLFLRFFVPAILNPRLFHLVPTAPNLKCQRTLTLVAKSLQGLANFSTFGQKEPWMQPMNAFVDECSAGLVDFLDHVSTPVESTGHRQEWTSAHAAVYTPPNRLKAGLSPVLQEGIPRLPHLIDLPRELGSLASRVSRLASVASSHDDSELSAAADGPPDLSAQSGRPRGSTPFERFVGACVEVAEEANRKGGAFFGQLPTPARSLKPRASVSLRPREMVGRPGRAEHGESSPRPAVSRADSSATDAEELLITRPAAPVDSAAEARFSAAEPRAAAPRQREPSGEPASSRRIHRSFTVNGRSPNAVTLNGTDYTERSFSNDDLSALASLDSVAEIDSALTERGSRREMDAALSSALGNFGIDVELPPAGSTGARAATRRPVSPSPQRSFPPPMDSGPSPRSGPKTARRPPPLTMPSDSDLQALSSRALSPRPPTARVRITQETVTTESLLAEPDLSPGEEVNEGFAAASSPYESSGALARPQSSASIGRKSKLHGWASGWTVGTGASAAPKRGLTSSASLASISFAAGPGGGRRSTKKPDPSDGPSPAQLAARRASSAEVAQSLRRQPSSSPVPSPAQGRRGSATARSRESPTAEAGRLRGVFTMRKGTRAS